MSYASFCRVCLADNVNMHIIHNTSLQEVYEILTNIKIQSTNEKILVVCNLCHSQLHKCHRFMTGARKAQQLLEESLTENVEGIKRCIKNIDMGHNKLLYSLSIGAIWHHSIEPEDVFFGIKDEEEKINQKDTVKNEVSEINDDNYRALRDHIDGNNDGCAIATDSEDDVPLNSFSVTRKSEVIARKKLRKKTNKDLKLNCREIILTKEEQLGELLARAKTLNYLNSPLRCDYCYRGFIDANAFNNHMEKHHERSGDHECDICHMRYQSARHLRMHTSSAHSRLYRCNQCPHTSHTKNQAREHEKWHGGHTYECQLCSHKFGKSTSYLTHMRKSHPTEYVCNICGKSCIGRHGLLMHKSKTHRRIPELTTSEVPPAERFCSECNVQFISLDAWKTHILTSVKHSLENESNPQCKICGEQFTSKAFITSHMRGHEKTLRQVATVATPPVKLTELTCDQCGAKFVNRSKLHTHVKRIHLGVKYNKDIVCEVCGKKCVSNASLRYHQRTHTGERPYSCERCVKRFSDANQLRIHTRTHTGERPYCCAACGKRFSQKPALNRHYRIHTGVKPYECQFCSKSFSQSNSMKLHVKTVHLKQGPNRKTNKTANNAGIPEVIQNKT